MVSDSTTCYLLDANVLISLAWPQHVHHAKAHGWFRERGRHAWATCALTQLAFVRISANHRVTIGGVTPRIAAQLLARMTQQPGHRYWSDLPSLAAMPVFGGHRLFGHQQVTDLYLLGLARQQHGCLATFDRGIPPMLPESERAEGVELLA